IDYNGRFCMSSAAAAGIRAFGLDRGLPFPLSDLGRADTLLMVGANVSETMPPLARYLAEQTEAGGALIVIDPRVTPTALRAALALGLPGRPGSGYGCLTGQGNGQGGREHGQKADQLPGYRRIDDPAARAHVASVWGVEPPSLPGPGVSATELLDLLGTPDGPK